MGNIFCSLSVTSVDLELLLLWIFLVWKHWYPLITLSMRTLTGRVEVQLKQLKKLLKKKWNKNSISGYHPWLEIQLGIVFSADSHNECIESIHSRQSNKSWWYTIFYLVKWNHFRKIVFFQLNLLIPSQDQNRSKDGILNFNCVFVHWEYSL